MLYRRLVSQGMNAARISAMVGPPPTPSGMPFADATAAVIQARARLESPRLRRSVPEQRRATAA